MPELQEWKFDPKEILSSKRKVKGIFHKSVIDKDNEFITPDAIKKSIPDYMHLPALHDFHKERPVGLATKIWQEKDGSFGFEGVIKSTEDCDDIWEKISKGNYDHVSIFGRRTEGNQNCSLPQGLRTGPCITNGVRLDSISVCDDNARNDYTSLAVKKAQLIWDGMDMIQKAGFPMKERIAPGSHTEKVLGKEAVNSANELYDAEQERKKRISDKDANKRAFIEESTRKAETAEGSNLMHTPTDYAKEQKCPCSKKKYKVIEKGDDMDEDVEKSKDVHYKGGIKEGLQVTHRAVRPRTAQKRGDTEYEIRQNKRDSMKKGDEEDDEMTDEEAPQEVEKGQWEGGEAEVHSHDIRHRGKTTTGTKKRSTGGEAELKEHDTTATSKPAPKKEKKREPTSGVKYDKMEKGDVSEEDADDEEQYDEESDSSKKKVSPKDKEGNWAKDQPGGSNVMKKGEKEQEIDTKTRGKDTKEEMDEELDEDEDDEEVEKGTESQNTTGRGNLRQKGSSTNFGNVKDETMTREDRSHEGVAHGTERSAGGKSSITSVHTSTVHPDRLKIPRSSKRTNFHPIKKGDAMEEDEEISQEYVTKAMVPIEEVDTIIKARTEEISKAYTAQFDEIKKAYDAKIAELNTRVDKMSEEVIRKGGSIVVIPQLLDASGQGIMSNADALAKITAGK